MYSDKSEFEVPMEERLLIYPKPRQQLFLNLVENYKLFCPTIKMIYAALNYNGELKIDYLVIFEASRGNKDFILWDAPFVYTNRAVPAYRYAVKTKNHKAYFETCMQHFCQMERDKFFEFIHSSLCGTLSNDPNDKKYWRLPENAPALMKGMSEMGLLYIPEGFRNPGRRTVE